MRFIKDYTSYIINENYNQAKALSEKHKIDITPVLSLLIGGNDILDTTKYPIKFDNNRERKNRSLIGLFTRMYIDGATIDVLGNILKWLDTNKASELLIKNNKDNTTTRLGNILDIYKIVESNEDDRPVYETLSDAIATYNKDIVTKKWVNRMPSNLRTKFKDYEHLYKELGDCLLPFHDLTIDEQKEVDGKFFGNGVSKGKISMYDSPDAFFKDLRIILADISLTYDKVLVLLENRNDADLIAKTEDYIVLKVYSFEASRLFGEKVSWCISREERYFTEYYAYGDRNLFFIFNFKEGVDILDSKVGVCVELDDVDEDENDTYDIYAAHNKNDDSINIYKYLEKYDIPANVINYDTTPKEDRIKKILHVNQEYIHDVFSGDDIDEKRYIIKFVKSGIIDVFNDDIYDFIMSDDISKKYIIDDYDGRVPIRKILHETKYFDFILDILDNKKLYYDMGITFEVVCEIAKFYPKRIDTILKIYDGTYNVNNKWWFLVYFYVDGMDINELSKNFSDIYGCILVDMNTANSGRYIKKIYDKGIKLSYIQKTCNIKWLKSCTNIENKYLEGCCIAPNELLDSYVDNDIYSIDVIFDSVMIDFNRNKDKFVVDMIRILTHKQVSTMNKIMLMKGFDKYEYLPYSDFGNYGVDFIGKYQDYFKYLLSDKNRGMECVIYCLKNSNIAYLIKYMSYNEFYYISSKENPDIDENIAKILDKVDKVVMDSNQPNFIYFDEFMMRVKLDTRMEKYVADTFVLPEHAYYLFSRELVQSDYLFDILVKYNKIPKNLVIKKSDMGFINQERLEYGVKNLNLQIEP